MLFKTNWIKISHELMKCCSWCPLLSIHWAFDVSPVGGVSCFFGGRGKAAVDLEQRAVMSGVSLVCQQFFS